MAAGGIHASEPAVSRPRCGEIGTRVILPRLETYRRKLTRRELGAITEIDSLLLNRITAHSGLGAQTYTPEIEAGLQPSAHRQTFDKSLVGRRRSVGCEESECKRRLSGAKLGQRADLMKEDKRRGALHSGSAYHGSVR